MYDFPPIAPADKRIIYPAMFSVQHVKRRLWRYSHDQLLALFVPLFNARLSSTTWSQGLGEALPLRSWRLCIALPLSFHLSSLEPRCFLECSSLFLLVFWYQTICCCVYTICMALVNLCVNCSTEVNMLSFAWCRVCWCLEFFCSQVVFLPYSEYQHGVYVLFQMWLDWHKFSVDPHSATFWQANLFIDVSCYILGPDD